MPSPEALVDFVVCADLLYSVASPCLTRFRAPLKYETIRSKATIEKQMDLLTSLEVPMTDKPRGTALSMHSQAIRAIGTIEGIAKYYGEKIGEQGDGFEIGDVMKLIGAEIERDGVRIEATREPDAPP